MTEILTPKELAARWKMHLNTIANMRNSGSGPVFFQVGSSIRYDLRDIEAYEADWKNAGGEDK